MSFARVALAVTTAMHELAVREAVPLLTVADFQAMRQANTRFAAAVETGDAEAAIRADEEFHAITVTASGNAALRTVLEQFTPPLLRAARLRFSSPSGHDAVVQHSHMIERGESGDVDAAVAATRAHWQELAPLLGRPLAGPATT
ncbi:FCD domain-containing protein [Actinoplanes sp. NPDC048988]|uniref:FCD domain-containing protein n=1 Tax=Actinoplanes sp. NPDC048988 TaxID=3363901 RepID=UPI0037189F09